MQPDNHYTPLPTMENLSRPTGNHSNKGQLEAPVKIVLGSFLGIETFLATMGNLIVLWAFKRDRELRIPRYFYIFNLCMCDLVRGLFVMPMATMDMVGDFKTTEDFCVFGIYLSYMLFSESVLSIILISWDRYIMVKDCLAYLRHETVKRTFLKIGLSWLLAIAWNILTTLLWHYVEKPSPDMKSENSFCTPDYELSQYIYVFSIIEFGIPLAIIAGLNLATYSFIAKSRTLSNGSTTKTRTITERYYALTANRLRHNLRTLMRGYSDNKTLHKGPNRSWRRRSEPMSNGRRGTFFETSFTFLATPTTTQPETPSHPRSSPPPSSPHQRSKGTASPRESPAVTSKRTAATNHDPPIRSVSLDNSRLSSEFRRQISLEVSPTHNPAEISRKLTLDETENSRLSSQTKLNDQLGTKRPTKRSTRNEPGKASLKYKKHPATSEKRALTETSNSENSSPAPPHTPRYHRAVVVTESDLRHIITEGGDQDDTVTLSVISAFKPPNCTVNYKFRNNSAYGTTNGTDCLDNLRKTGKTVNVSLRKVAKSLAILVGIYFVCWIPTVLCIVINRACNNCIPAIWSAAAAAVAYLDPALNPVIYGLSHKRFAKNFKEVIFFWHDYSSDEVAGGAPKHKRTRTEAAF